MGKKRKCIFEWLHYMARPIGLMVFFLFVQSVAFAQQKGNVLDKLAEGKRLYNAQDYTAAFECYRIAAEAGNSEAQFYFASCYYYGMGVEQDLTEAAKWFRKSAEQGNKYAQRDLGIS